MKGIKMAKIRKTQKNINKLAQQVVDDLDLDTLLQWAYEHHQEYYENMTSREFQEEWKATFE